MEAGSRQSAPLVFSGWEVSYCQALLLCLPDPMTPLMGLRVLLGSQLAQTLRRGKE